MERPGPRASLCTCETGFGLEAVALLAPQEKVTLANGYVLRPPMKNA